MPPTPPRSSRSCGRALRWWHPCVERSRRSGDLTRCDPPVSLLTDWPPTPLDVSGRAAAAGGGAPPAGAESNWFVSGTSHPLPSLFASILHAGWRFSRRPSAPSPPRPPPPHCRAFRRWGRAGRRPWSKLYAGGTRRTTLSAAIEERLVVPRAPRVTRLTGHRGQSGVWGRGVGGWGRQAPPRRRRCPPLRRATTRRPPPVCGVRCSAVPPARAGVRATALAVGQLVSAVQRASLAPLPRLPRCPACPPPARLRVRHSRRR